MKNIIVARPGFLGTLLRQQQPARIDPAPMGESVLVRFPKDTKTLDELDVWLKDHPRAQVVVLGAYPHARKLQRQLARIALEHGVGILIKPQLDPKDLQ